MIINNPDDLTKIDDFLARHYPDVFEYVMKLSRGHCRLLFAKFMMELVYIKVKYNRDDDHIILNFHWKDDDNIFGELGAEVERMLEHEQTTD